MLSKAELARNLVGVGRLLRFDPKAFAAFDRTIDGFWRSFWVAAIIFPFWAYLAWEQMGAAAPVTYALAQGIGYVVGWLAYPLLVLRLTILFDRAPRYLTYMVAYNWFQVTQTAVLLLLILLDASNFLPRQAMAVIGLSLQGVMLVYNWFIAKRGLTIEGGTAAALVIIDFLLGLLIDGVANSIG